MLFLNVLRIIGSECKVCVGGRQSKWTYYLPMIKTDLLIIGASFAGLACARQAAKAGLSVTVVEKKSTSGAKLHTTGILVKEAVDEVPWLQDTPSHLYRPIEGVRLYAPNMNAVDLRAPGYFFWATETPGLLNWMVEDVRALGVRVLTSTLFETAKYTSDCLWHVPLQSRKAGGYEPHHEVQARYLVGADGPMSRVARALGFSRNTEFLFGIEHEYADVDLDPDFLHCFIDRRLATGYIGWALATQGYSQIGLAKRLPSLRQDEHYVRHIEHAHGSGHIYFDQFIEKISSVVKIRSDLIGVRAGMIPCGGTLNRISCPQAMLVGDAAGTVSPVTAGGIRSALTCGEKAGVAVADYLHGRAQDPAQWLVRAYPRYRGKRLLRQCFDRWQSDWLFNQVLATSAFQRVAQQVYFHRKGHAAKAAS